jgi:hypothetical protein
MIEDLKKAVDIIVPHDNEKQFYKTTLDLAAKNPNDLFENGRYRFGYLDSKRDHLTPDNRDIPKYLFFDLLTEIYLQLRRKIINKDSLWSTLSVFLVNNQCNHLRKQLDFNIYDNKEIDFTVDNASRVFADSDYMIYLLTVHEDEALGFLHKDKFDGLKNLLRIKDIELKELG